MPKHKWVKMVKTILYKSPYWVCSKCGALSWFDPTLETHPTICSEKET